MHRERGAGRQALALAIASGVSQALVAIAYLWVARISSIEIYGAVVAAIALGTTAVGWFDFGANALWVRELAAKRMTRFQGGQRALSKLLMACVAGIAYGIIVALVAPGSHLVIAAPVCIALVANQLSLVPLRAAAMGERAALGIVVSRVVTLGLLWVLILLSIPGVDALWISLVAGSVISVIPNVLMTPRPYRFALSTRRFTNPWQGSAHYGIFGIAVSMQGLDLPLLAWLGGPIPAGIYAAVNRWTQPLGLLASAFASATTPFIARTREWTEVRKHILQGLWMPLTAIGVAIVVAVGAPWIVPLLLGSQYDGAIPVLQVLALGTIPAIANQPLAVFAQAIGLDRAVGTEVGSAVLFQLVGVAVVSETMGAIGAALCFAVAQLLLCLALGWTFLRGIRRMSTEATRG